LSVAAKSPNQLKLFAASWGDTELTGTLS